MKNSIYTLSLCCLFTLGLQAQTANDYLASAKSSYSAKNHQEARFQLQQALIALDELVAQEILAKMPSTVSDLNAQTEKDQYSSVNMGFTGLYVNRQYQGPGDRHLNINIMNDAPLLANLSSLLANPLMAGMAGMKVVRFDGYKGAVEEVEGSSPLAVNINIPFGDSLMTLEFKGAKNKEEAIEMAQQLPIGEIIEIAK